MTRWWHVSWKRVLVGLAVVIAGLYLIDRVIFLMKPWFAPWFEGRAIFHNDDYRLRLTPANLPDNSVATLHGVTIQVFGIALQTPWPESPIVVANRNMSRITFSAERTAIVFFNPASAPDSIAIVKCDPKTRKFFGENDLKSNYGLFSEEMLATPTDLHWWKTHSANARSFLLLGEKSLKFGEASTLYSIQAGEMKGFQFGAPSTPPYHVRLDLFDPADRHYEIHITSIEQPALSQAQLNAMIASIRPVSTK